MSSKKITQLLEGMKIFLWKDELRRLYSHLLEKYTLSVQIMNAAMQKQYKSN